MIRLFQANDESPGNFCSSLPFDRFPPHARKKADVVSMKNGDKFTYEVKGLRANTLYIKVPYILGTLSVD